MIVVSDSSPLIYLAWIGRLELLQVLFEEVIVPPIVYQEITIDGKNEPGSKEVLAADWVHVQVPKTKKLPENFHLELDDGEKEAIELSLEIGVDFLLIDEKIGRTAAQGFGITVTGVLGILVRSKEKGLIPNVKDEVEKLLTETTFWVSKKVVQKVLELANEK